MLEVVQAIYAMTAEAHNECAHDRVKKIFEIIDEVSFLNTLNFEFYKSFETLQIFYFFILNFFSRIKMVCFPKKNFSLPQEKTHPFLQPFNKPAYFMNC